MPDQYGHPSTKELDDAFAMFQLDRFEPQLWMQRGQDEYGNRGLYALISGTLREDGQKIIVHSPPRIKEGWSCFSTFYWCLLHPDAGPAREFAGYGEGIQEMDNLLAQYCLTRENGVCLPIGGWFIRRIVNPEGTQL